MPSSASFRRSPGQRWVGVYSVGVLKQPDSLVSACHGWGSQFSATEEGRWHMVNRTIVQDAINTGEGILRLAPCWVPRSFMIPGRRLRLHPDDLYAFGANRGGINERWFSSTTKASNGPLTTEDEGLSYVVTNGGEKVLLKEALAEEGD